MGIVKSIKISLVMMLCFCLTGCGAEAAALIFIPIFSATWPDANDPEHELDLQPDEDNKNVPSGVFEGQEFHQSDSEKDGNPLSGSFDGLDIEFTIHRQNNVNIKYTGKMIPVSDTDHTIVRIELNSTEGPLILQF